MPLMGHYSYPGVMDEFLAHWSAVDAALVAGGGGAAGLVVRGGVNRPGFLALSGELRTKLALLEAKDVGERVAAREILLRREVLLDWMGTFYDTVRLWWEGRPEGALVVPLPNTGAALDKVLRAARGLLRLWERVDGGSAPAGMVLPLRVGAAPGLDRAGFTLLMQKLEDAREEQESAAFEVSALRVERDALEVRVRKVLGAYVRAVPALLAAEHPLLASVPRISPLPGHTPEPVAVQAEWLPEDQAGKISWAASEDAALDHYEVRWYPGETYDKKEERLAFSVDKEADRVALVRQGQFGLVGPGAEASFKVYVVLTTDNERGSAAVVVRSG